MTLDAGIPTDAPDEVIVAEPWPTDPVAGLLRLRRLAEDCGAYLFHDKDSFLRLVDEEVGKAKIQEAIHARRDTTD